MDSARKRRVVSLIILIILGIVVYKMCSPGMGGM
jgi:hypothetical protein